jgi:acetyl esterase/lipase
MMNRLVNHRALLRTAAVFKAASAIAITMSHAFASATISPRLAAPVSIPEFIAAPRPPPAAEIPYGPSSTQGIDVFVPAGRGPFPVAILIHGGCWSTRTAAREQVRHLGAELAKHGVAVWSIGYRRANEAGGGYPGTYRDVGMAIDRIRDEVGRFQLDLAHTVLVGHSAGGHLALWAAGRRQLANTSELYVAAPFVPRNVVTLAGIGDLKSFAPHIPQICGADVAENLLGKPTPARPDVYADTSPALLGANGARVVMLSGILDRLVPPYVAHDYARAVSRDVDVELVNVPGAGHFDLVTIERAAWGEARRHIEAALAR